MAESATGGAPAPAIAPTTGGTAPAAATAQTVPSAPSPIKLTADSLIEIDGETKGPVKYGDHFRGFKSELTRKSQELAKLQPAHKQALERAADLERRLTLALGGQPKPPDPNADFLSKIEQLGYLDGRTARELSEHLLGRVGSYDSQLQERDKAILMLGQIVKKMHDSMQPVLSARNEQTFKGKMEGFLKKLELDPADWEDFATETYLAYEPSETLDEEFPEILQKRIEQAEKAFQKRNKARMAALRAEAKPWLPGKGGEATPSRPAPARFETPAEVARNFHRGRRSAQSEDEDE